MTDDGCVHARPIGKAEEREKEERGQDKRSMGKNIIGVLPNVCWDLAHRGLSG